MTSFFDLDTKITF